MNDKDLENVTGGVGATRRGKENANDAERTTTAHCPFCNKNTTFIVYSGSRGKCKECGNVSQI
ncbi:hypothetical protein [Butyrivibrio sp. VCB2006]|uniref:hypothetical protein n=1 Tax=Butyrivibrio sp. VCB2006 TaxID=1280679 RepID=UPI0018CBEFF0|nr:hypothetical protein [Butyrivibrio sp. VCB2006]